MGFNSPNLHHLCRLSLTAKSCEYCYERFDSSFTSGKGNRKARDASSTLAVGKVLDVRDFNQQTWSSEQNLPNFLLLVLTGSMAAVTLVEMNVKVKSLEFFRSLNSLKKR